MGSFRDELARIVSEAAVDWGATRGDWEAALDLAFSRGKPYGKVMLETLANEIRESVEDIITDEGLTDDFNSRISFSFVLENGFTRLYVYHKEDDSWGQDWTDLS